MNFYSNCLEIFLGSPSLAWSRPEDEHFPALVFLHGWQCCNEVQYSLLWSSWLLTLWPRRGEEVHLGLLVDACALLTLTDWAPAPAWLYSFFGLKDEVEEEEVVLEELLALGSSDWVAAAAGRTAVAFSIPVAWGLELKCISGICLTPFTIPS